MQSGHKGVRSLQQSFHRVCWLNKSPHCTPLKKKNHIVQPEGKKKAWEATPTQESCFTRKGSGWEATTQSKHVGTPHPSPESLVPFTPSVLECPGTAFSLGTSCPSGSSLGPAHCDMRSHGNEELPHCNWRVAPTRCIQRKPTQQWRSCTTKNE